MKVVVMTVWIRGRVVRRKTKMWIRLTERMREFIPKVAAC